MSPIQNFDDVSDAVLLEEVKRRFDQKNSTLRKWLF